MNSNDPRVRQSLLLARADIKTSSRTKSWVKPPSSSNNTHHPHNDPRADHAPSPSKKHSGESTHNTTIQRNATPPGPQVPYWQNQNRSHPESQEGTQRSVGANGARAITSRSNNPPEPAWQNHPSQPESSQGEAAEQALEGRADEPPEASSRGSVKMAWQNKLRQNQTEPKPNYSKAPWQHDSPQGGQGVREYPSSNTPNQYPQPNRSQSQSQRDPADPSSSRQQSWKKQGNYSSYRGIRQETNPDPSAPPPNMQQHRHDSSVASDKSSHAQEERTKTSTSPEANELPPFILPQKEKPKTFPPVILPQTNNYPKNNKALPPVILPMNNTDEKGFPHQEISAHRQEQGERNDLGATHEDDESQQDDSGIIKQQSSDNSVSWNETLISPRHNYHQQQQPPQNQILKPPTYRPPVQSSIQASQKSPWQKWSQEHSNQNKQGYSQNQTSKSEEDDYISHEEPDYYIVDEKKSGDNHAAVSMEEDDENTLEAAADAAFDANQASTHLAQMAADSTLIVDYEEAIKHALSKLSDDEEDSYMSGNFTGNHSALPQDLPLEFQQALDRSPVRVLEELGVKPTFSDTAEEEKPALRIDNMRQSDGLPLEFQQALDRSPVHAPDDEPVVKPTFSDAEEEIPALPMKQSDDESVYIEDADDGEQRSLLYAEEFQQGRRQEEEEAELIATRVGKLEIDVDQNPHDEDIEDVPTTTPQSISKYPRLTPSPRDNDAYRMVYFGDESPASIRGKQRQRSSPVKEGNRGSSSPPLQHGSPLRDGWAEEAGDSTKYNQVFFGHDYGSRDPGSSPAGHEESSTDNSSRGQSSTLQGSYPDELLDGQGSYPDELLGVGRSREFDSAFPDPEVDLQSDVESSVVFGSPKTFGIAGGDAGGGSPSVLDRSHAIEDWQGGLDIYRQKSLPMKLFPEDTNRVSESQISRFWSSGTASQEEQDEAANFDETDQWLDKDPDLDGFRDDASLSPETKDKARVDGPPEANALCVDPLAGWHSSSPTKSPKRGVEGYIPSEPVTPNARAWDTQDQFATSNFSQEVKGKKSKRSGSKKKKDTFDPFGDTDDLKISDSDNLFSPTPDPFMTEESFSPPDWTTPRGRINHDSPDWQQGVEI
jgi:hypothetical protein